MDTVTKERISEGVRKNWAARKLAARQLQEQTLGMAATNRRLLRALYACAQALEPYAESDRLAAFALEELEAANDAITVSNHEARETLAAFGEPDPTEPAAPMADGETDDADGRRVPKES